MLGQWQRRLAHCPCAIGARQDVRAPGRPPPLRNFRSFLIHRCYRLDLIRSVESTFSLRSRWLVNVPEDSRNQVFGITYTKGFNIPMSLACVG
jgi:hypothetical protein